jgi:hypothetical protein
LINCDVPGKQHGSGHNLDDELLLDELLKLLDGLLLDGLLELDEGLLELEDELGSSQQHAIDAGSGIIDNSHLLSKCLHSATRKLPQS